MPAMLSAPPARTPRTPEEIATLCDRLKLSDPPVSSVYGDIAAYDVGTVAAKPISLRAFFISNAVGTEHRSIMVLVERIAEKHEVNLEKARREFSLSKRELEVLQLICRGMSNREIAEKMFICEYTVKDHIKKIMKRMNAKSRSEIVAALTSEIEFRT